MAALTLFAGLQVYRHRFGVPSLESEHETTEKEWFKFGSNCSSVSRGQIIPNLHIMKLGVTREIECESETQIAK